MLYSRNFLGGLMFLCLGLGTMAVAAGYPVGSATRMGPGYFPLLVGGAMSALALVLLARAVISRPHVDRVSGLALRPVVAILGAIAAFGLLVDARGLIVSISALVAIARLSRREGSLPEVALVAAALSGIAILVFVTGLGMTLRVVPW